MSLLTTQHAGNSSTPASNHEPRHSKWNNPNLRQTGASGVPRLTRQIALTIATLWLLSHTTVHAAGPHYLNSKLVAAMERTVTIQTEGSPLRQWLDSVSRSQEVPLFLDRRVDPTGKVNLAVDDDRLSNVLRQVGHARSFGVGYVGSVLYIGPPLTAARITTLAVQKNKEATELSKERASLFLRRSAISWPHLSEPEQILQDVCSEARLVIANWELIPHDLWRAADYPDLTLPEKLTLLLAGFGLTYDVDETTDQILLIPIPRAVAIDESYEMQEGAGRWHRRLQTKFPGAFLTAKGTTLRVRATVEDQIAIAAILRGSRGRDGATESNPMPKGSEQQVKQQVYSLRVQQQPLGPLIEKLADRLHVSVTYSETAKKALKERVSFDVSNVTVQALFQAAVEPANLNASYDAQSAVIRIE